MDATNEKLIKDLIKRNETTNIQKKFRRSAALHVCAGTKKSDRR